MNRDDVARAALAYIALRDFDLLADAFANVPAHLKADAADYLGMLAFERMRVVQAITGAGTTT